MNSLSPSAEDLLAVINNLRVCAPPATPCENMDEIQDLVQACLSHKAELGERLSLLESIRSRYSSCEEVKSAVEDAIAVLHQAKLEAIELTGAAQQLRNIYLVSSR